MLKVEIFVFGEFRVLINNENATDKIKLSRKKKLLLEYLIINYGKTVSISNLVDILWDDNKDIKLENTLKTLVSRLRKDLLDVGLKNAILTKKSAYMWNTDYNNITDIFKLEEICNKLKKIDKYSSEVKKMFEEVIFLYSGDLLNESELNQLTISKVMYFRNMYFDTIQKYIGFLKINKEFTEIVSTCKRALEIDHLDSKLNVELMDALVNLGKPQEAMSHYRVVTSLYYSELGAKPTTEIIDYYKELIVQERRIEDSAETIFRDLKESDDIKDALVCDYSILKDIYKLYIRNFRRTGTPIFLIVVSLKHLKEKEVTPMEMDLTMKNLLDMISKKLRVGDVIARYSLTQYVMLMPNIPNYSTGRLIMERIKSTFYSKSENVGYIFDFKHMQIEGETE